MNKLKNYLLATGCLVTLVAALLLSGSAWAQELDKSSSLTIEKDSRTAIWTGICDVSVSGLDPRGTYSGIMYIWIREVGAPSSVLLFYVEWDVSPENRTWTDSVPDSWTFRAKRTGRTVNTQAEVTFGTVAPARIKCDQHVDWDNDPGGFETSTTLHLRLP